ncbi:hypothetical protein GSI_12665 [Ganoderma sinense ZZ0214-1]|uniref:Uncharacterized protein n=1 Tax=Ganoderma sinense ZZ0214-1 TaxID=1077348 RepID=A0A2G8RTF0_9APHY|nr:hypothetical protein GSI_12665 [Ganoderma sinense ZZ0214-1]
MRLLDTIAGQFIEVFNLRRRPRYAILSHTWSLEGEQTYQELKTIQESYFPAGSCPPNDARAQPSSGSQLSPWPPQSSDSIWDDPRLSPKIFKACQTARLNGYRYIWIDSCCIDKSSSSELSEAINSMYMWYRNAGMCYVYLADVPGLSYLALSAPYSAFRTSRWFARGWTLQELLAPQRIVFLSQTWSALGTKVTLKKALEEITGISGEVLLCEVPLDRISVARRMSWAAARETTRVEDRAYSLFGIFDVNLPTLYGEGDRAFQRLQEEILRRIPDQSLFAWSEAPFYTNVVDETNSSLSKTAEPSRIFRASKGPNIVLALSSTSRTILEAQGYTVEFHESSTHIPDDRTYDLLIYMRDSRGTGEEGPSTSPPSSVLSKSLKLTTFHRLREDRPLTMWVIHGPHTLDLLRGLEPSSSGPSDIDTYDPQQTTVTRQMVSRRVQDDSINSPLICFAPTEIPPSTYSDSDGLVETLHLTLEPNYSHDFYHVHVEISTIEREAQPPPLRSLSSSQVQLVTTGREVFAADSRERLPKTEQHLIPPWTDPDDHVGNEGGEEALKEPSVAESGLGSRGRVSKWFRRWRK